MSDEVQYMNIHCHIIYNNRLQKNLIFNNWRLLHYKTFILISMQLMEEHFQESYGL